MNIYELCVLLVRCSHHYYYCVLIEVGDVLVACNCLQLGITTDVRVREAQNRIWNPCADLYRVCIEEEKTIVEWLQVVIFRSVRFLTFVSQQTYFRIQLKS